MCSYSACPKRRCGDSRGYIARGADLPFAVVVEIVVDSDHLDGGSELKPDSIAFGTKAEIDSNRNYSH